MLLIHTRVRIWMDQTLSSFLVVIDTSSTGYSLTNFVPSLYEALAFAEFIQERPLVVASTRMRGLDLAYLLVQRRIVPSRAYL